MKTKGLLIFSLFMITLSSFFVSFASASELGDIVVRFCDETSGVLEKKLSFELDPLEKREVCIKVFNTGEEEASVKFGFVDGTVTKDASQYKACLTEQDTNNFAKFASIEQALVVVPAKGAIQTKFALTYPEGYAGMSYGCLVTKLLQSSGEVGSGTMSVELRQGHFVDVFVNGEILLDVHLTAQEPSVSNNQYISFAPQGVLNSATSSVSVVNSGNIAQSISVEAVVRGWFGYQKTYVFDPVTLTPSENKVFAQDLSLPWFSLSTSVEYVVSATPSFDFESSTITDTMRETVVIKESMSYFLWHYILFDIVFILLLVLVFVLWRRRKNLNKKLKKESQSTRNIAKPKKKSPSMSTTKALSKTSTKVSKPSSKKTKKADPKTKVDTKASSKTKTKIKSQTKTKVKSKTTKK